MSCDTKSMYITPVGGNVFADLGFDQKEADALMANSQRIISEEMAKKESMATDHSVDGFTRRR